MAIAIKEPNQTRKTTRLMFTLKFDIMKTRFALRFAIVMIRFITPAGMQKVLKCVDQSKLKKRKTQARLPGALVYLSAKSYLPQKVSRPRIIANRAQNPTNLCKILLFAQLLLSPIPNKPTNINTPANNKLTPKAPRNIFLLNFLVQRIIANPAILNKSKIMLTGCPTDEIVAEQFWLSIFEISWQRRVCRASWRKRRWWLQVRITCWSIVRSMSTSEWVELYINKQMDFNSKLGQFEQRLKNQKDILQIINTMCKRQAMRVLKLQSVLKFKGIQQQQFLSIYSNANLQTYDEYSNLLSKGMASKIAGLIKKIDELRNAVIKAGSQIKLKKEEEGVGLVGELQGKIDGVVAQVGAFWRDYSFLMANYRLDIVAKDLEKWNRGLHFAEITVDVKQIEQLFKP